MRLNLKKVSAIGASILLAGMSMGVAAAAAYPSPFVVGGAADVAIVYGAGATLDVAPSTSLSDNLATYLSGTGGEASASGGDNVLLAKSSDNLNIGDTWGTFTGSVDEDDLSTLLADGTYVAGDNDEFDYEQKITIGTPRYTHFRDSDYEDLAGLATKTPVLGFRLTSSTQVLNYTLDFTQDAESDIDSGDLEDIEGSDLMLLGKTYYVSDLENGTDPDDYFGKLTLLDSATTGTVNEDETVTITSAGSTYTVSMSYLDDDEVKYLVNGVEVPSAGKLQEGQNAKLADGAYIGVRDISKVLLAGETGSSSFSIGSGKLEITSGSDVRLNDEGVDGVVGYVHRGTDTSTTVAIDKIEIRWETDDEEFLSPLVDLVMPGFEAVKFTMGDLVRPTEEKITLDTDGDDSIEMTIPIEDGTVSFNLLYANTTGEFVGIGGAADELLVTSNSTELTFIEKNSGADYHKWFIASYAIAQEAESYLLRAEIKYDSTNVRNETNIDKYSNGQWVEACKEKIEGEDCDIGEVTLTFDDVHYEAGSSGTRKVTVTGTPTADVSFNTIYTDGGLKVHLPYESWANWTTGGAINLTCGDGDTGNACDNTGHNFDSWYLFMESEDREDNLGDGGTFTLTIDNTGTYELEVESVYPTGASGDTSGTAGTTTHRLEMGTGTNTYEVYVTADVNDTAPRIVHYTNPDENWAEIYYPTGDSETYGMVYLAEADVTVSSGGADIGDIVFKDTESASYASKNVIVVGGTCINSAAASLLGVSAGTCGSAWEAATGVGEGEFLIQSFGTSTVTSKVALLVAGWEAQDTVNAATYLKNQKPDTAAGNKYVGSTATSAELIVS